MMDGDWLSVVGPSACVPVTLLYALLLAFCLPQCVVDPTPCPFPYHGGSVPAFACVALHIDLDLHTSCHAFGSSAYTPPFCLAPDLPVCPSIACAYYSLYSPAVLLCCAYIYAVPFHLYTLCPLPTLLQFSGLVAVSAFLCLPFACLPPFTYHLVPARFTYYCSVAVPPTVFPPRSSYTPLAPYTSFMAPCAFVLDIVCHRSLFSLALAFALYTFFPSYASSHLQVCTLSVATHLSTTPRFMCCPSCACTPQDLPTAFFTCLILVLAVSPFYFCNIPCFPLPHYLLCGSLFLAFTIFPDFGLHFADAMDGALPFYFLLSYIAFIILYSSCFPT